MHLSFSYPLALLVMGAAIAGALTFWVYQDTVPELSSAKRILLGSLRFLTLLLVILLLAEPLIQRLADRTEAPLLAILVDESESMAIIDPDSSDADGTSLSDLLNRLAGSVGNERTRVFGFGQQAREALSIDSLRFTEPRTDISTGLESIRTTLENESLGAVLLVSDGRHNGGRNPEHLADLYPVPIVTVTVGDTTIQKDIRIQQVLKNDLSYTGREVPVRVRVRNEGFEPSRIRIDLSTAGRPLDNETVMLPPSGSELEVELAFEADSVGLFQYRVDITRLQGELTHRNNTEFFSLQVLERERRVMILAGAPSPDVAALRRMLSTDADTELDVRTQKGTADGLYYEGPWPDGTDDLDLLVLVGYPSVSTPATDVTRVVSIANRGTPILFIADRSTDLRTIQSQFSTVLPVRPSVIRPGFVQGMFVPTEIASRHAIFDITDRRNLQSWGSLPPIGLSQTRWEVSETAATLATTQIRGISIDDPILVVGRIGNRRSAALLASGFWKWSNVPVDLLDESDRWGQLFSNLVLWLVTEDDDRLVRVSPVESLLNEGEAVVFSGQVYDENLQPLSDASVTVDIQHPTGEIFPYTLLSLGSGQYRADVGSLPQGTYSFSAVATLNAGELGTDQGNFTVGALSAEFRNPYSDSRLMQQIAQRSGGIVLEQTRLNDLPAVLASLPSYSPTTETVVTQVRLWRYLPLLFVLLSLMTLEWFFRKRFGLV